MEAHAEAFGDAALRMPLPARADPSAVLRALRAVPGVVDVVVCEQRALVTFDPVAPVATPDLARALLEPPADADPPRTHRIAVRYDGPDLDDLAVRVGLSPEEVVRAHTAAEYTVASVGFLPGFAYLAGLDPRLRVPRRDSPRPRVQPLSVAVAGPYAGVYPFASPGGWNLLGTALGFAPFDPAAGAALALGDRVWFVKA